MKNAPSLILCGVLASAAHAQIGIDPGDWQADVRFLQDTVHEDYPFLFKKVTAEAFDAEVEKLHRSIPELQEHEIIAGLTRLVASFQYGHTALGVRESRAQFHQLPLSLYYFADGVHIEGVHEKYEGVLGARVLEIEGVPVDDALAAIRPAIPAENDQFFKANGLGFLRIPEVLHAQGVTPELDNEITLTLERNGTRFEQTITAVQGRGIPRQYGFTVPDESWLSARDPSDTPAYLKHLDRIYYDEYWPENKTVYIRHSQIQDDPQESIQDFYDRVFDFIDENDVERLVLDLRLNGGGNNYKNKPIVTGIVRTEKINQPGRLFVIIGRRTFSACQNLVNELDNYTNAIFVGEPTAENVNFYGDNRRVELPNSGIPVYLSFAWWQDKPQWENDPWTAPHVFAEMTFDDYRSNRDPVLDAALDFSGEDFILDPMGHLAGLFQAGKLEEVEAEAERLVRDPRYRYLDFEDEANQVGYELLGSGQVDSALFVFRLNNRLYPESANTWDSLGEALWKAGQLNEARSYYNKAIELDPDGSIGANARTMLRQMSEGEGAGGG
ncbi:MAG: S41 family peptidase [Planctomycetota bacterium]|jgi:tetratricopeptide (TPR) repeat protein